MKKKLAYRQYGFAIYQLNGHQAGIQFKHAGDEYDLKYPNDKEHLEWKKKHKTVILLNGGTTNDKKSKLGTIQQYIAELKKNKVKFAVFREPDLNDAITAVTFTVSELAYDSKKYPQPGVDDSSDLTLSRDQFEKNYAKWEATLGKQNVFLRTFLKSKKLHT